jgi:hypothetical protein
MYSIHKIARYFFSIGDSELVEFNLEQIASLPQYFSFAMHQQTNEAKKQ